MISNLAGTSIDPGDCRVGAVPLFAMTWIIRWCIKSELNQQKSRMRQRSGFFTESNKWGAVQFLWPLLNIPENMNGNLHLLLYFIAVNCFCACLNGSFIVPAFVVDYLQCLLQLRNLLLDCLFTVQKHLISLLQRSISLLKP